MPIQEQGDSTLEQTPEISPATSGQEESYFSFKDESGKDVSFKTKDDLAKAWKDSGMMRSDYTRKTQGLAEERKKFESEQRSQKEWYDRQMRQADEYKKYDTFLKSRPDVFKKIQEAMKQPMAPQDTTDFIMKQMEEKYGSQMSEFNQWKAEQEAKARRDSTFAAMKSKYEDFDEEAMSTALSDLANGDMNALIENLYFAAKGRQTPMQIQKEVVENLEKKKSSRMVPGGNTSSSPKEGFKNLREARERAIREQS